MNKKNLAQIIRNKFTIIFFPIVGLAALAWFLVRVLPKPSRASYPCQRVAAGVGSGFIAYLLGSLGLLPFLHKFKYKLAKHRGTLFSILTVTLFLSGALLAPKFISSSPSNTSGFVPVEPVNQPTGEAKGYFPGRVAWVQDRKATPWDGVSGFWWDDTNTNQAVVAGILSRSLLLYTEETGTADAYEVLFQHFNTVHGRGSVGYQPGEKIVIKINSNQDWGQTWDNGGFHSPHLVYSLVSQLINVAGVAGSDITIADPSRYVGDPIYNIIRGNPGPDFQDVKFVVKDTYVKNGRIAAVPDYTKPIYFEKPYPEDPNICIHYPPTCYTEATYLINLALLRSHSLFGATLCAKNHFGSVFNGEEFKPQKLHGSGVVHNTPNELGNPHCHPALIGHPELGGKTLLYIIDAIYTVVYQGSKTVVKWQSLGNDYFSGLLLSQDPVAIDSVAVDFLRTEPNMQVAALTRDTCNYLHESALAQNPPSGAFYDPDNDGVGLQSLGTHEHWNNRTERLYSRDLGTGEGIELVRDCSVVRFTSPIGGQTLQRGTFRTITWQADNLKEDISILLWKDGAKIGVIAKQVDPVQGSYRWKVGKLLDEPASPGTGYRIIIKERGYKYIDYNETPFTFVDLFLKSPDGGEELKMGSVYSIRWRAAGFTSPIGIGLMKDGKLTAVIVKKIDPGVGSYSWRVGDFVSGSAGAGTGYTIKIKARELVNIKDVSNPTFTITD